MIFKKFIIEWKYIMLCYILARVTGDRELEMWTLCNDDISNYLYQIQNMLNITYSSVGSTFILKIVPNGMYYNFGERKGDSLPRYFKLAYCFPAPAQLS